MRNSVLKNAGVTLITQILNLVLKFLLQKAFIESLGVAYLGYNSVFSNILQMLNLADLGVGTAITGFLYKPIANREIEKISALMSLYKRIYSIMGIVVSAIGAIIMFFLPTIIPDAECSNNYLRLLFAINLVGSVSTYFMAYNRTLLIAQQKAYYVNLLDACTNIVFVIAQIVSLFLYPNYIIFLVLNVSKNIFGNIIITISCNRKNRFLRSKVDVDLFDQYKKTVFHYVKDVFVSKIGAYIYYGTDNIIISIFKGSLLAGFLSNYSLVIVAVQSIISAIFAALQANFGNLIVTTDDTKKKLDSSDAYLFVNYIIANMSMICCIFLFQPFIRLYIGEMYLLNGNTVILLSVNLFFSIMLLVPSQLFVIYKLFKYDKIIIAFSASLNIIISVLLVKKLGVNGVLIGTLITSLIYVVSRLFIVSKNAFNCSFFRYMIKMLEWGTKSCITIIIINYVVGDILIDDWIRFVVYAACISIASVIIPIGLSFGNNETKFMIKMLKF